MRALLIDAKNRRLQEVRTSGKLEDLYRLLGCRLVECVSLSKGTDLWIDEEGLLAEPEHAFSIGDSLFAGNGLLTGGPNANGEITPCDLSLSLLELTVVFHAVKKK